MVSIIGVTFIWRGNDGWWEGGERDSYQGLGTKNQNQKKRKLVLLTATYQHTLQMWQTNKSKPPRTPFCCSRSLSMAHSRKNIMV